MDQESDPDTDFCLYCDQGDLKNEKLITCKDCVTTGDDGNYMETQMTDPCVPVQFTPPV